MASYEKSHYTRGKRKRKKEETQAAHSGSRLDTSNPTDTQALSLVGRTTMMRFEEHFTWLSFRYVQKDGNMKWKGRVRLADAFKHAQKDGTQYGQSSTSWAPVNPPGSTCSGSQRRLSLKAPPRCVLFVSGPFSERQVKDGYLCYHHKTWTEHVMTGSQ